MTADAPVTANVSMTTQTLPFVRLNFVAPQRPWSFSGWLYRWVSLLPAVWLFPAIMASAASDPSPLLLLLIVTGSTFLITLLSRTLNDYSLVEIACFLAVDLGGAAALLAYSGDSHSPYYWYALSPLLAAALLFQRRGALVAAAIFTPLYLLILLFVTYADPVTIEPERLLTQLVGIWLVPLLLGYPLELLQRLERNQEALTTTQDDLARQHAQLTAAHDQLEIIHDLTLRLQGASDIQSVQAAGAPGGHRRIGLLASLSGVS